MLAIGHGVVLSALGSGTSCSSTVSVVPSSPLLDSSRLDDSTRRLLSTCLVSSRLDSTRLDSSHQRLARLRSAPLSAPLPPLPPLLSPSAAPLACAAPLGLARAAPLTRGFAAPLTREPCRSSRHSSGDAMLLPSKRHPQTLVVPVAQSKQR